MNKKQLEKEVLKLKSQGLSKEQIKKVLTKSVPTEKQYTDYAGKVYSQYAVPGNYEDGLLEYLDDVLRTEDIKECGVEFRNNSNSYTYSNSKIAFDIWDTLDSKNNVVKSEYFIRRSNGRVYNWTTEKGSTDILRLLTPQNPIYYSLRWACIGITWRGEGNIVPRADGELFIDNIRDFTLQDILTYWENSEGAGEVYINPNCKNRF